jgi:uncharacterized 2Fe-2S/4Fe-4S cluster protein (DUF4445 family)
MAAKEMKKFKIKFLPSNKEIEIPAETDLLTAAIHAGIHIYNSCGGEGICGRCRVIIKQGEYKTEPSGRISKEEREKNYVLACRTTPHSDIVVEIPPESRIEDLKITAEELKKERLSWLYTPAEEIEPQKISLEERIFTESPLSTKLYLELPPPTLEDNCSDLERLYREIRKKRTIPIMQTGLSNIRKLGYLLRASDWKITVLLGNRNRTTEIVVVEPGNTTAKNYGIAVDVGTTTVVAYLVNLNTKEVLSAKASYNKQIDFGEDVISRIIFAQESDRLERLHHAVIDTINKLIRTLAEENKIGLDDIYALTVAGNTTMIHLLLKVEPTFIRKDPYVPTANFVPVIRAAESGIKIHPRGLLAIVPGVSSYVGGDITAGILATGVYRREKLTVFIDLGTNGEIVLGNKDWLICCSTSAGPCFEGGGIKWGVRAMEGAIQKIEIKNNNPQITTIGNSKPIGICGTGIVDIVAELFLNGIIEKNGNFKINNNNKRVRLNNDEEYEYILCYKKETAVSDDIVITQSDIKNIIHSKGAIYTGMEVLLNYVGLKFKDVDRFFIAGGLGTYLDIEKAIVIGLLPDLEPERFSFMGNTTIQGAKLCLLSQEAFEKVEAIANKLTNIELSSSTEFMNRYNSSLFLPHTDIDSFPNVKEKLR